MINEFRILSRAEYRTDYRDHIIATLGPSGTSSEFVARQLSERVMLLGNYEMAEAFIHDTDENALLLVANAYQYINRFYISQRTGPIGAFFCDTPPYVLASKNKCVQDMPDRPRISSHRAPAHLLEQILPDAAFTLVEADSTSAAARMTAESTVDACITTKIACEKEGLTALYDTGVIPMLWTLFARKA
ncbi:Bacilysin biosynthesis protein BacA Similarities with prephenate dehydratase [Candidatus Burkholderia verschuerenii]|uniref:Bacilysin biosynthesis protein BacA Similarities with prephenate dehydratase n=1 Tax=Candidatus Burkholderia verschuerenii TaxID=242163 RepID=A0A0L0M4S7_9BURK|nr:hypothetical protein [Candidatus Burkholderia verschuerenii]KND57270.1 Bacilysin biosynthesis protein BacA Similarities with prephenate dehydratase [Candidatus Burkholderia verschuerenii]